MEEVLESDESLIALTTHFAQVRWAQVFASGYEYSSKGSLGNQYSHWTLKVASNQATWESLVRGYSKGTFR